jgi:hypothetical protein
MNFLHERDLGDIILSLASVQAAGGGNYYIQNNPNAIRMLAPLIEHQPYINKCGKKLIYKIDKSFVDFRNGGLPYGVPLAELHARWIKQHTDLNKQWLFCPKDNKFKGRIIVNKTNRYANPLFPWKEIVNQLGESILFVGHDNEYDLFCRRFGKVERLIVKDYLELAIAINSSECFIGNQSSANCVAEGLKHRTIQEVCLWTPDCIYKRDNATFCYDGKIDTVLSEKRIQVSAKTPERYIDKSHTPSGGWRLTINGKTLNSYSIDVLVIQAQSAGMEKPKSEIEKMVVAETLPFVALDPITERLLVSIQKVKELIG